MIIIIITIINFIMIINNRSWILGIFIQKDWIQSIFNYPGQCMWLTEKQNTQPFTDHSYFTTASGIYYLNESSRGFKGKTFGYKIWLNVWSLNKKNVSLISNQMVAGPNGPLLALVIRSAVEDSEHACDHVTHPHPNMVETHAREITTKQFPVTPIVVLVNWSVLFISFISKFVGKEHDDRQTGKSTVELRPLLTS